MNIMMTKKEKSCSIKPTVWLMNVCLLWHPQRAPGRAVKKRNTIKENQVGDKMGAKKRRIYDTFGPNVWIFGPSSAKIIKLIQLVSLIF